MRILKKVAVVFLSIAVVLSTTACSNKSWAMKTNDETLAIGVYIFYMSAAYSEAYYKVGNPYSDLLSQTIDDKNVSDWIKDSAMESCKKLLVVDKLFDDAGLSFTDEEIETANSTTDAQWKQYGKRYEKFGISKESFHKAGTLFELKSSKLFDSMYGENGSKAISDDELKNYFLENYIDYSYIEKEFECNHDHSHDDSSDDEENEENIDVDNSDETSTESTDSDEHAKEDEQAKAEIESKFNSYLDSLNNGSTMESIAEQYKSDYSVESNPLTSDVKKLDETTSLPKEIVDALKEMDKNSSRVITEGDKYYLVHKGDVSNKLDKLESDKDSILRDMKASLFKTMIEDAVESLDVTINKRALDKYQPDIFVEKSSRSNSRSGSRSTSAY